MAKRQIELYRIRSQYAKQIEHLLEKTDKLWHGLIRLTITLSSSFLLLTLALAEKLFPEISQSMGPTTYLATSWILLFFAIISGIIAEINNTIFYGNAARDRLEEIKKIDQKLANDHEDHYVEMPEARLDSEPFAWGAISIGSFIFAVYCMCLSFLEKILSLPYKVSFIGIGLLVVIGIAIYLIRKRK